MFFLKVWRSGLVIHISAIALVVFMAGISIADENSGTALKDSAKEVTADSGRTTAAQTAQPDRITGEYAKGYFTDAGRILASPVNWNSDDWLKAGLIVGATSVIYFADTDIKKISQKNQSQVGDKFAAIGDTLGNPLYTLPPLGLFYLYGHINEDPKARRASLLTIESIAISAAFTLAIKQAAQRHRPFAGSSSTTWDGPGFQNSDPSFPSLHTTTAFSIASVLAEEYDNNPYVAPIAYGLATLTGLSRIYDNKHWASDVFFGAAIGYFAGKAVVSYHTVHSYSAVKIMPVISRQSFGLMTEYRF
ncbi:MAG: phosphatase PAP2 family protein [Geobacteraceae bacterium]|nr:phosphatase PAP2 family protein [Geobacteraceae bacterium]